MSRDGTEMKVEASLPGSAEWTAAHLTGRGLATCSHFPKYRIDEAQGHSKYPSRLGFFHTTALEPRISFLDTNKLCEQCLDIVVPNGFNFWSSSSNNCNTSNTTEAGSIQVFASRWLDIAPSSSNYPLLTQAGTEGFSHVSIKPETLASHLIALPVAIPIPQITGANEAWRWLQDQQKPFYIDQLHLTKGWTSLAERKAKLDVTIAKRSGTEYTPSLQSAVVEIESSSSDLTESASPNEAVDVNATFTKKKKTPKPTTLTKANTTSFKKMKEISSTAVAEKSSKTSSTGKAKKTSKPKSVEAVDTSESHTIVELLDGANEPVGSSSPRNNTPNPIPTLKEKGLSKGATTSSDSSLMTAARFAYTRNWCQHDPIPFDSPIATLKLSDYQRRAGVVNQTSASESYFSLSRLMEKTKSNGKNSDLSGPGSMSHTTGVESFLRATKEKFPTQTAGSPSNQSIMDQVSFDVSSPAKARDIGPSMGNQSKQTKSSSEKREHAYESQNEGIRGSAQQKLGNNSSKKASANKLSTDMISKDPYTTHKPTKSKSSNKESKERPKENKTHKSAISKRNDKLTKKIRKAKRYSSYRNGHEGSFHGKHGGKFRTSGNPEGKAEIHRQENAVQETTAHSTFVQATTRQSSTLQTTEQTTAMQETTVQGESEYERNTDGEDSAQGDTDQDTANERSDRGSDDGREYSSSEDDESNHPEAVESDSEGEEDGHSEHSEDEGGNPSEDGQSENPDNDSDHSDAESDHSDNEESEHSEEGNSHSESESGHSDEDSNHSENDEDTSSEDESHHSDDEDSNHPEDESSHSDEDSSHSEGDEGTPSDDESLHSDDEESNHSDDEDSDHSEDESGHSNDENSHSDDDESDHSDEDSSHSEDDESTHSNDDESDHSDDESDHSDNESDHSEEEEVESDHSEDDSNHSESEESYHSDSE